MVSNSSSDPVLSELLRKKEFMDNQHERWLPIPGFEGHYEVSDHGRVRSLDRVVIDKQGTRRRKFKGRMLKPQRVYTGYDVVGLSKDGKPRDWYIHRLVLMAFCGPPAPGAEGCHNNDIRSDNRLENLRWDTHLNNVRDAVKRDRMKNPARDKTHCKRGHELGKRIPGRRRRCIICRRYLERVRYHRQRQAA